MPRNVEVKARVRDWPALSERVRAQASEGPTEIDQDDTFFACENGRLKLRAFSDGRGELIFYRRSDESGPKASFYVRTPTATPDSLRDTLSLAYGQSGRVRKHRTLFLIGRTRVHLDQVEGLGDFMELEVVLVEQEPPASGIAEAHRLMGSLGVSDADLVEGAYLDLLNPSLNNKELA